MWDRVKQHGPVWYWFKGGGAHLVVAVQGHHHAFFQVVQRNGLQDVQVVGHLVLDGARTVDDVLKNNTITIINSPNHCDLHDVQYKEN